MQSRASMWSTFWGTGRERKRPEFRVNDSKHSWNEPENKSLAASQERWRKIIIKGLKNTGSKYTLWTLSSASWFQYKWNKGWLADQYASKTKGTRENRIKTLGREGWGEGGEGREGWGEGWGGRGGEKEKSPTVSSAMLIFCLTMALKMDSSLYFACSA